MSEYRQDRMNTGMDDRTGAGCVSTVMVFVVILFIMGAVVSSQERPLPTHTPVVEVVAGSTPRLTPTLRPTLTATVTETPTATDTATPRPTAMRPATSTPRATVTQMVWKGEETAVTATATAIPPTETATATPTATTPPLPTPNGTYSWTLQVPVLMYHYISVPPKDADIYRKDLSVAPEDFRAQMAYLAENGYSTIDFYDLSLAITNKRELPPKSVIITLDDGYIDNYTFAFPILQEFGFKATFFVISEFVDFGYEGYLTWEMVEEMSAAGMRIESHSRTHPDLRGQPRDYLIWQILGSQETIAAHIGYIPRYFSYPAGHYDEETVQILQDLHFWGAVTTSGGKWHGYEDRFAWRRLRVRQTTPLAEFADLVDVGETVGGKALGN